jgi:hypothetical protein
MKITSAQRAASDQSGRERHAARLAVRATQFLEPGS